MQIEPAYSNTSLNKKKVLDTSPTYIKGTSVSFMEESLLYHRAHTFQSLLPASQLCPAPIADFLGRHPATPQAYIPT